MRTLANNDYATIAIDDGIVYALWKQHEVSLEIAQQSVSTRLSVTANTAHLLYADIRKISSISKEAREFLGSEKGSEGVLAAAILVNSSLGSVIANFFMKINKPAVPTKLFTEEEPAKKWLRAQLMKKED